MRNPRIVLGIYHCVPRLLLCALYAFKTFCFFRAKGNQQQIAVIYKYEFAGSNVHCRFLEIILLCVVVVQIKIEAINLESLVVKGIPLDHIKFSSCKKIRNLSLCRIYLENNHLEALISNIPLIENLALSNCNSLEKEHIKISSQHLKCFHYNRICSTFKVLIWPENLKNLRRRHLLLNWKHLKVNTDCKPEKEKESNLKDALMRIAPSLETLRINENVIF
ncbi:uncharacterized protein LOC133033979 [Cannabis sativa]|uniref:uncharacterized protein LOC133033979 n=1 Tax=Cannabis sativa TaxID=3483 RepID=UPI0029C9E39E|nr:uncharacterized protein LOC133033979 [Cannabis sativa]